MTVAPRYAPSDDLEATGLSLPLQLPSNCERGSPVSTPADDSSPDSHVAAGSSGGTGAPLQLSSLASLHRCVTHSLVFGQDLISISSLSLILRSFRW